MLLWPMKHKSVLFSVKQHAITPQCSLMNTDAIQSKVVRSLAIVYCVANKHSFEETPPYFLNFKDF